MITAERAQQIASEWHTGQWSALYSFASSGEFHIPYVLRYFREIEDSLHPEYAIHPYSLSIKHTKELNRLKDYLIKQAETEGIEVEFHQHQIYGYLIPILSDNVSDEIANTVEPLKYLL